MLLVLFQTNLKDTELAGDFEVWLSTKVAEVLRKPIEKIALQVSSGIRMCKKGIKDSPMCVIQIHSIGSLDAERNPTYTSELTKAIKERLNFPNGERILILYVPIDAHQVGIGK